MKKGEDFKCVLGGGYSHEKTSQAKKSEIPSVISLGNLFASLWLTLRRKKGIGQILGKLAVADQDLTILC